MPNFLSNVRGIKSDLNFMGQMKIFYAMAYAKARVLSVRLMQAAVVATLK